MINPITIRQASIHDLPEIIHIFDSYRQYFKQERDPDAVERFLFERFEHRESAFIIVEIQMEFKEVIGFAHLYPTFSSLTLQRVWILNDFFVDENYRSNGIGKQLLDFIKDFAVLTKSKGIELTVEHANSNAWNFYEKQGFKLDEEFRVYFYKVG
jgi:GNAT superfamily N-acetyltransferase